MTTQSKTTQTHYEIRWPKATFKTTRRHPTQKRAPDDSTKQNPQACYEIRWPKATFKTTRNRNTEESTRWQYKAEPQAHYEIGWPNATSKMTRHASIGMSSIRWLHKAEPPGPLWNQVAKSHLQNDKPSILIFFKFISIYIYIEIYDLQNHKTSISWYEQRPVTTRSRSPRLIMK